MAAAKQLSYNDIIANIRKKKFASIYILQGEEHYFIDRIADLLQSQVVEADARDFDLTVMYGADSSIDHVINNARRFPMFSDHQLVMLKEAQSMHDAKGQLEKLESYALNPVPATILVITFKGDTLKQTSKFIKNVIKSGGVIFESKKPKDWQLDTIISDYCKENKIAIDKKSIEMLKSFVGADIQRLFREIDKLTVSTPDRQITPKLIEANIGISKDFNNFELIKALSLRQYAKSMQIINYFEKNPKQNPSIPTVALIYSFFSNLFLAYCAKDKSDSGLMAMLRFKTPYQLIDIKAGLAGYNVRACMNIIHAIRGFDCKAKGIGSYQNEYLLLKELIYNIFTA